MDIMLIAGLWLPVSVWSQVAAELEVLGHRPLPVPLPGVDDVAVAATLDDQLSAVLAVVDNADRPLIVGHSAACTLAWMAADRRPDAVAGVAMIGGFPTPSGDAYADFFPVEDGGMAFPGWEPFEGPDAADLDDGQRSLLAGLARPVPAGVATAAVQLSDERRHRLPIVLICPEFAPDQAREWIAQGEVPELQSASDLTFVDIDSGHWPMVTRPGELARLLCEAADDVAARKTR